MNEVSKANIKKEYAALVLMIRRPENIALANVRPGHFQIPQARQIFNVLTEIRKREDAKSAGIGSAYDFSGANIKSVAKEAKMPVDADVLDQLLENVEDFVEYQDNQFDKYCDSLRNASLVNMLIGVAENIKEKAEHYDIERDATELVREAEADILQLENQIINIDDPVRVFSEELLDTDLKMYKDEADSGNPPGLHSGFKCIDGGMLLRPGSLTVIGARSKVGKSAFALNLALNVAKHYGGSCPVLYLDTEMSGKDQRSRALSIMSNVAEERILRQDASLEEQNRIRDAVKNLNSLPIFHQYMPSFSAEAVLALVRRMYHSHGIRFLIFDYIKLPDNTDLKSAQEYQFLGYFTSMLKNKIAGALSIPVLTFAQLNRDGIKQAQTGEVDESSVGGSDRIIQYCSNYLVLRKSSEKELKENKYANRKLHSILGRHGGESGIPIDLHYKTDDGIPLMEEVKEIVKRDAEAATKEATGRTGKLENAGNSVSFGGDKS